MRDSIAVKADTGVLLHETEVVICVCGHSAQVHHGVDPVDGCMIVGLPSSVGWCDCTLTGPQVMEGDDR